MKNTESNSWICRGFVPLNGGKSLTGVIHIHFTQWVMLWYRFTRKFNICDQDATESLKTDSPIFSLQTFNRPRNIQSTISFQYETLKHITNIKKNTMYSNENNYLECASSILSHIV